MCGSEGNRGVGLICGKHVGLRCCSAIYVGRGSEYYVVYVMGFVQGMRLVCRVVGEILGKVDWNARILAGRFLEREELLG